MNVFQAALLKRAQHLMALVMVNSQQAISLVSAVLATIWSQVAPSVKV